MQGQADPETTVIIDVERLRAPLFRDPGGPTVEAWLAALVGIPTRAENASANYSLGIQFDALQFDALFDVEGEDYRRVGCP